jgi:hypothetical protein
LGAVVDVGGAGASLSVDVGGRRAGEQRAVVESEPVSEEPVAVPCSVEELAGEGERVAGEGVGVDGAAGLTG